MRSSVPYRPPPRFRWPEGARCAVVLCFDVDGETTVLERGFHYRQHLTTWSQCAYGPAVGVPRLLGLLEHLSVPATFFLPGWIVEHHPEMARRIVAAGHEAGLHGWLHERILHLDEREEEAVLLRSLATFENVLAVRPQGWRAPWFEMRPSTPALLLKHGLRYSASAMGDDVPYRHPCGLIEIPGQWHLEDWEQFAFNADPPWGAPPRSCGEVFNLWWEEFSAMWDYGCCFVLTLHPWLSGRPARVRLLEQLVRAMQERGQVWFARARDVAAWFEQNPGARREMALESVAGPKES